MLDGRRTIRTLALALPLAVLATPAAGGWCDAMGATLAQAGQRVALAAAREWREAVEIAQSAHDGTIGLFVLSERAGAAGGEPGLVWEAIHDAEPRFGADETVVVLVHGLDEPGGVWSDLAPALAERGHAVVRFSYPNDQHPADSAVLLVAALERLRTSNGAERVSLVAHSMGGLVSREALTRDGLYGGSGAGSETRPAVVRLVTVATPHAGSALAALQPLGELRDQVARFASSETKDPRELLGFLADGRGEAQAALTPGSEFLEALNARPHPEGVAMTNIVGSMSPVDGGAVEWAMQWRAVSAVVDEEAAETLAGHLDELHATIGDGIVPLDSQRLEGVSDEVELEGNHRTLLRGCSAVDGVVSLLGMEPEAPAGIAVILERLEADRADGPEASGAAAEVAPAGG